MKRKKETSVVPESFASRLRQLMAELSLGQGDLAAQVGIERSHFSRLLKGTRAWQRDQLERVAAVFGRDLAGLIGGTDVEQIAAAETSARRAHGEAMENLAAATAKLQVLEMENAELKKRPTQGAYEAIERERDQLRKDLDATVRSKSDAERAADSANATVTRLRGENAEHEAIRRSLQARLVESNAGVLRNYNAATYWQKQAKGVGATASVLGALGLFALLSKD